jgi:hypothetical protein
LFRRQPAIVQNQSGRSQGPDAQLGNLVAQGEPGHVFLDQEHDDAFERGLRIRLGGHGEEVGQAGVGDPHIAPVQDVAVSAPPGGRGDRSQVRACVGFGHANDTDLVASDGGHQQTLFLLVGAETVKETGAHQALHGHGGGQAHRGTS